MTLTIDIPPELYTRLLQTATDMQQGLPELIEEALRYVTTQTRYIGVSRRGGGWFARVTNGRRRERLGPYPTALSAAQARAAWIEKNRTRARRDPKLDRVPEFLRRPVVSDTFDDEPLD